MPPKPHLGALPPAAVLEDQGHTDIGGAWDGLYGFYALGTDQPAFDAPVGTMSRVEARHVFKGDDLLGEVGGFVGRNAVGLDGGVWLRPGSKRRWAFRIAPNVSFGNYGGEDELTRLRLPAVGISGAAQWAKPVREGLVTSLTYGGSLNFAVPYRLPARQDTAVYWPMGYLEVHNRWDYTLPGGRLGVWGAGGLNFTWLVPGPVVSAGLKF